MLLHACDIRCAKGMAIAAQVLNSTGPLCRAPLVPLAAIGPRLADACRFAHLDLPSMPEAGQKGEEVKLFFRMVEVSWCHNYSQFIYCSCLCPFASMQPHDANTCSTRVAFVMAH